MGAGSYAPALTPAGFDPVLPGSSTSRELPPAPLVDKATRETPVRPDGQIERIHPVDSQMSIGLGTRQGTIAGAAFIGHTFHQVQLGQSPEQLQRDVEQRARAAYPVSRLLADGDVEIVSVRATELPNGLEVVTEYRNLRTGKPGRVETT